MDTDTGYTTTTEPDHTHFCSLCHANWIHTEDGCEKGPDYDCPMCVDTPDEG